MRQSTEVVFYQGLNLENLGHLRNSSPRFPRFLRFLDLALQEGLNLLFSFHRFPKFRPSCKAMSKSKKR